MTHADSLKDANSAATSPRKRVAEALILGLMRIADRTEDEIRDLINAARDAGIDYFDHADIYGSELHDCERRFADMTRLSSSARSQVKLQTKVGIVPGEPRVLDLSAHHIVESVHASLRALKTDYIDVLLLHRPDALVEPEEVAQAFDMLETAGLVLSFGVSNHTPRQIDLLSRFVRQPIAVNQLQLSLVHSSIIAQGLAMNREGLEQSLTRDGGGIVDYCRLNEITIQAWSPFQSGFFTGVFFGSTEYPRLNALLDRLAQRYAVHPIAIATAWITRHPAKMRIVIGSTSPDRVKSASKGAEITLTRAEWYALLDASEKDRRHDMSSARRR